MSSLEHYSYHFNEQRHGGHTATSTSVIIKATEVNDPDVIYYPNPNSPMSERDRDSVIILAVLFFLCMIAIAYFFVEKLKAKQESDLERQSFHHQGHGVNIRNRAYTWVKDASTKNSIFQMKTGAEGKELEATTTNNGCRGVEETDQPRRYSSPRIIFSRSSTRTTTRSKGNTWHRQDSVASTITPHTLEECPYHGRCPSSSSHGRGQSRTKNSPDPLFGCYNFPPSSQSVCRSSFSQPQYDNRCWSEFVHRHPITSPSRRLTFLNPIAEPETACRTPRLVSRESTRSQTRLPDRGTKSPVRRYDWTRPTPTSLNRSDTERDSSGIKLAGF